MKNRIFPVRGFTTLELMVGMVIGSIVVAAAYSLWKTHQVEGFRLGKKIDLRSEMTLSSKKIQRAVTLAGLGLNQIISLAKDDAIGSDTLYVYSNVNESKCALQYDASHSQATIRVLSPSLFSISGYVVLSDSNGGETRRILRIDGSQLTINQPYSRDFRRVSTTVYPATQQRFYTDQDSTRLICESNGRADVMAKSIHNFQVSFRNGSGVSTENAKDIRAVTFSFTGVFPAKEGALNSMVFASTAIPRNVQ
jgi:prepilin-type N-terminal cleavage/methylation domain-containing protein